jgi:ribokinase
VDSSAQGRVIVVGSYVAGLTIRADRLPVVGETLIGTEFDNGPGGKGSNQAVQARRLGSEVEMVARIGRDAFGAAADRLWAAEGVGTRFVAHDDAAPTGVGFITLDRDGANSIIVYPGANDRLTATDVDLVAGSVRPADVVIAQQEIPEAAVARAMRLGREAGALTILNPAPARPAAEGLLANVDLLVPNASEARVMLGLPPTAAVQASELGARLVAMGAATVIVTLGGDGAVIVTGHGTLVISPELVDVVDSTGAGDAFSGTLAAMLARGMSVVEAAKFASVAGALACTAIGVIPALPTLAALQARASVEGSGDAHPTRARQ